MRRNRGAVHSQYRSQKIKKNEGTIKNSANVCQVSFAEQRRSLNLEAADENNNNNYDNKHVAELI